MKSLKITSIIIILCTCLVLVLFSFYVFGISNTPQSHVQKIPEKNLPSHFNFQWLIKNGSYISSEYKRAVPISFGKPSEYTKVKGVLGLRGNNYRNSASYGTADITSKKLEKIWSKSIGRTDSWSGVGWNGQPAIVRWDDDLKEKMNLFENQKKKTNLKEIIYGTLDSNVYFLDMDTGEATRNPIKLPGPIKGSVTVDPRGYPILYVGQGIDTVKGRKVPIGFNVYNLFNQKRLLFIDGFDSFAQRKWGAFDSGCLVDQATDTLVEAGENGIVYTVKLNTSFDLDKSYLNINPKITKYRYKSDKNKKLGIENSVAIYKNYAYFADNDGMLQCLDLNTLSPVWARNVSDDTDSTIVLEEEGKNVFLYTACEVDKQRRGGTSYIRKINALTGDAVWYREFACSYNNSVNGGVLGTPVVGKHEISDLVIYDVARCNGSNGGKLVAFNKSTGKTAWELSFNNYSWSSPVDVYTNKGKAYIVFCDSAGNMFLIDGKKGEILDRISLGANIEGSPAVYENTIVVGTRGQKIWGIKIR